MIASLMLRASVVFFIVSMLGGIVMGMKQSFTLAPAHAHFNLVGGVLLFLFALYYRLVPAAASSRLASIQAWLHIGGAVIFPAGIITVLTLGPRWEIVPVAGALIVLAATVLFAVIVWRHEAR